MKNIKIAYIGGGSKMWARVFMYDLALTEGLCGEIALYDIDIPAARRNAKIGERLNAHPAAVSRWKYTVCERIEQALDGADFVALSILPGTLDEMAADVHLPEKYGVYQSVGDTVGPGGVMRAMRTVPIYEYFAHSIKQCCPQAWVINLTNPMTVCTRALYDVFPQIKAFGCCHEVFHAQEFLACVAHEQLGVPLPDRREINIDASGINHFTWITEAYYKDVDLLKLLPSFAEKFFREGYCEQKGRGRLDHLGADPFLYGNKVKMELYFRYGALAAAGDRHLVEFMPPEWFLSDPAAAEKWGYHLTGVDFRKKQQAERVAESEQLASGEKEIDLVRSDEECVDLIRALLGETKIISNANVPNAGQTPYLPSGVITETNCVFYRNSVKPVLSSPLPPAAAALVQYNSANTEALYHGIKTRDAEEIFSSFLNQPLLCRLSADSARSLFREMADATQNYLKDYYNLKKF